VEVTVGAYIRTGSDDLSFADLSIVVSQEAATTTIALNGEWDLAQRERMRCAIQDALACRPDRVVLDLGRLTFMDSSGVYGVIELATRAAHLNIDLVVVPGPRAVRRLFELCGISESLTFADAA
jgi:anti-sigma B factor antagonist